MFKITQDAVTWAPLRESTSNTSCDCIFFVCDRHMSSMLSHCPVSLHLLSLHHQNSSQSQHLLTCRQKTVELWRQKNGDSRYAKDGTRLLHKGCSISLNLDILWPLQIMPEQLRYVHICMRTMTFHLVDRLSLCFLAFSDSRSSREIFFLGETNLKLLG